MDRDPFYTFLEDWSPRHKASFDPPLAHFERSPQLSDEEFIDYCMSPLLEKDIWKQVDLVTEIDFDEIDGLVRRDEKVLLVGKFDAYRALTSDDTDVLLPLDAIVEMYREQVMSDRYLPTEEELSNRSHRDSYLFLFDDSDAWPDTPEHKPEWEEGTFYLLVEERWNSSGYVEPDPHVVGCVFQSKYAKWILETEFEGIDQGWKRVGGLEYNGLDPNYSCHIVTNRPECINLLTDSIRAIEEYTDHVDFNPKGLTKEAWELVLRSQSPESQQSVATFSSHTAEGRTLRQLAEETLNVKLLGLSPRFEATGWRYQGRTNIECFECGTEEYEIFRKPYTTSQGNYEYWGIVCSSCLTCSGLDVFEQRARKLFSNWSKSISSNRDAAEKPDNNRRSSELGKLDANKIGPTLSSSKTPKFKEIPEEILPLPGDPGATRRPGKKREHYRTGEEASLRHIARKHRWW